DFFASIEETRDELDRLCGIRVEGERVTMLPPVLTPEMQRDILREHPCGYCGVVRMSEDAGRCDIVKASCDCVDQEPWDLTGDMQVYLPEGLFPRSVDDRTGEGPA